MGWDAGSVTNATAGVAIAISLLAAYYARASARAAEMTHLVAVPRVLLSFGDGLYLRPRLQGEGADRWVIERLAIAGSPNARFNAIEYFDDGYSQLPRAGNVLGRSVSPVPAELWVTGEDGPVDVKVTVSLLASPKASRRSMVLRIE